MKKLFKVKLAILAMIIACVFVMGSCEFGDDGGGDTGLWAPNNGVSVRVSNQTQTDLVAFKGSISKENLLGGVRAGQTNHALQYASALGQNPAQFRMVLITEAAYKNGLNANTPIFTQMFIFWNGNVGDNSKIYEISDRLGGENTVQLWNTSNYDIELRVGGVAGPTLGYAVSGMTMTPLRVGDGEYMIYPVFQRVNTVRKVVESVVPRMTSGPFQGQAFGWDVNLGPNSRTISLNMAMALAQMASRTAGAASIIFNNASGNGARIYNGVFPLIIPGTETQTVNAGAQQEFIFDMPTSSTGTFANSRTVSNLYAQVLGNPVYVEDLQGGRTFSLENDKMYTVDITGDMGTGFTAIININAAQPLVMPDVTVSEMGQ